MVKQIKNIITESEKNRIKDLYGLNHIKRDYIFESCITVNDRYFILHDEVFDLQEKKTLGNVWSSIDVFKNIFKNTDIGDNDYTVIKEGILSLPLLEGKNDLYNVRDFLLEWNFWDDTWLGSKLKNAGTSIKDAANVGWEGLKKLGVSISQGEWTEIMSLLGKGVVWILRKLKDALYSTVGMIVDAILVATGIGKTVQWIPWALVTALDVYQFNNDDWPDNEKNDPKWMKLLFIGFDILGLMTTGVMAKSGKKMIEPLLSISKNSPGKITQYLEKNPNIKSLLVKMKNSLSSVPSKMKSAQNFISSKFPKGGQFISNIMGSLSKILTSLEENLTKLLGEKISKGVMGGGKTSGMLYGLEKGMNKVTQLRTGLTSTQIKNIETMDDVFKTKYGGKDPFDL